jgi:hypothetical protein
MVGKLGSAIKAFEAIDNKVFVSNDLYNLPRLPAIISLVVVFTSPRLRPVEREIWAPTCSTLI